MPSRLARPSALVATLVLIASAGCGSSDPAADSPAPTADSPEAPSAAETPTEPDAPEAPPDLNAGSERSGESYQLAVSGQEHYAAGELGSFGIVLSPRGDWHVNQDYQIRVQLAAADGVTLPKSELEQADAAEFSLTGARFDVPFTAAAAGSPRVAAKVSFAMCSEENCMLEEQTVALALPVQ